MSAFSLWVFRGTFRCFERYDPVEYENSSGRSWSNACGRRVDDCCSFCAYLQSRADLIFGLSASEKPDGLRTCQDGKRYSFHLHFLRHFCSELSLYDSPNRERQSHRDQFGQIMDNGCCHDGGCICVDISVFFYLWAHAWCFSPALVWIRLWSFRLPMQH